jgi:hypothetical protein
MVGLHGYKFFCLFRKEKYFINMTASGNNKGNRTNNYLTKWFVGTQTKAKIKK